MKHAGIAQRESVGDWRLDECLPPRRSQVSSPAPRSNPFDEEPRLSIGASFCIWFAVDFLIIAAIAGCALAIKGALT